MSSDITHAVFPRWFRELMKVAERIGEYLKPLQDALEMDYRIWFVDKEFMHVYTRVHIVVGVTDPYKRRILVRIDEPINEVIKTIFHERCHVYVCELLFQCDADTYHSAYVKLASLSFATKHPEEVYCEEYEKSIGEQLITVEERVMDALNDLGIIIGRYIKTVYTISRYKSDWRRDIYTEFPHHVVNKFVELLEPILRDLWRKTKNELRRRILESLKPDYEAVLRGGT